MPPLHLSTRLPHRGTIALCAALALVYSLTATWSLSLASLPGNVSAVWPPTGIAIAAVLLRGRRLWPGVFLGAFVANYATGLPVVVAAAIAAGNTGEALAASWLLDRARPLTLASTAEVVRYVAYGCLAAPVVSATTGNVALVAAQIVPVEAVPHSWLVWWVGDCLGALLVGAAFLVWSGPRTAPRRFGGRAALAAFGLTCTALLAFGSMLGYPYLVFPFLMWASIRGTQRGAVASVLLVASVAVVRTADGVGPFSRHGSVTSELWRLDFFLGVVALTALLLAATASERNAAARGMRDAIDELSSSNDLLAELNTTLEARVAARTAELEAERHRLEEAQQVGHIGSWDWDIATDHVRWSAELHRLFGTDTESFVPTFDGYLALIHPEDRERVRSTVRAAGDNHRPYVVDHRVALPEAGVRWIRGRGHVTLDTDGRPCRMAGTAQDITQTVELEQHLRRQAEHDPLTGLANRAALTGQLTAELLSCGGSPGAVTVLFCDIDRFKQINDTYGHAAGDDVLLEVARRLSSCIRPGDTVARLGGDEFVIIYTGLGAGSDRCDRVTRRVVEALAAPYTIAGSPVSLAGSIGVAASMPGSTAEQLLREADQAMYQAKQRGGAQAVVAAGTSIRQDITRHVTASALRIGLDDGEITCFYQPIVRPDTGQTIGLEALARWQHPVRGLLGPDWLLDQAEIVGLGPQLTGQLLRQACLQMASINSVPSVAAPLRLTLNLSAAQLAEPDLVERMTRTSRSTGHPLTRLDLDLDEPALAGATTDQLAALHELRHRGVRICLDRFGRTPVHVTKLSRYRVDLVKLDSSLIAGLGRDADADRFVAALAAVAADVGVGLSAIGVEARHQADALVAVGCHQAQGLLWSPPLPASAIRDAARSTRPTSSDGEPAATRQVVS